MSAGDWKDLFKAACEGNLALVRYHVESGVSLNHAHPEFYSTPLVGAILAGQEAIALYMLDHGADPALRSEFDNLTPLEAARHTGLSRVQARLIDLGARDTHPWVRTLRQWLPGSRHAGA